MGALGHRSTEAQLSISWLCWPNSFGGDGGAGEAVGVWPWAHVPWAHGLCSRGPGPMRHGVYNGGSPTLGSNPIHHLS